MADQMDENSEAAEASDNKSLDQNAIDEALAAMQIDDSENAQAAAVGSQAGSEVDGTSDQAAENGEPIAHANHGETFGESEGDGQAELDAAIAAMQADVEAEGEAAQADESESGEASQLDIDAAIAAMQADGGSDYQNPDSEKMDDADEAPATDTETADALQAIDTAVTEAAERNDIPEAAAVEPLSVCDDENAFSGLEESEIEENTASKHEHSAADSGAAELSMNYKNEFSRLDGIDSEPAFAVTSSGAPVTETLSASYPDSPMKKTVGSSAVAARKKPASISQAESSTGGGYRKKRFGIFVAILIISTGAGAYFGRDLYSKYFVKSPDPPIEVSTPEPNQVKQASAPTRVGAPADPYYEKLQEVALLRADLLAKKDEIDELSQFYRDGISELEEEVQQELSQHNVQHLSAAVANHKIKLDLESIQRRWSYIDELTKPYHWLNQGSEELLFLSRRTEIDLQMSSIASGIELTRHMRHLNASLQKYQLSPERLAIEVGNSRLRPLEEIWQAFSPVNKDIAKQAVANGDQEIIEEICGGNTGRIAELRTLTIKVAKCLAQMDAAELFLNQLTSLSPVAAKYLCTWKGQWLCLNGYKVLAPEVARHLFRWEGNWISLNGLKEFDPRIGELLLSWEGDQLELMGLEYNADQAQRIGLQQLLQWERAGGKLFVPEAIRIEMGKLK